MVERDVVGNAAWVRLDDRGIVVTGAAQGIGRAIARAMARAGARVLIADRNEEGAALAAEDIRAAGGRAWSLQVDVTVAEQVEAMIDAAVERLGRLDVLVNNAGIVRSGPLLECSERDWDD
ncbi:MAG TPA: SDR family NAD(P)-dependent oxidoreductase, partial [Chloroflexota bacterium]